MKRYHGRDDSPPREPQQKSRRGDATYDFAQRQGQGQKTRPDKQSDTSSEREGRRRNRWDEPPEDLSQQAALQRGRAGNEADDSNSSRTAWPQRTTADETRDNSPQEARRPRGGWQPNSRQDDSRWNDEPEDLTPRPRRRSHDEVDLLATELEPKARLNPPTSRHDEVEGPAASTSYPTSYTSNGAFGPGGASEGGPGGATRKYFDSPLLDRSVLPSASHPIDTTSGLPRRYWNARLKNYVPNSGRKMSSANSDAVAAKAKELVNSLNIYLTSYRGDKSIFPSKPKEHSSHPRLPQQVFANHFIVNFTPSALYFLYQVAWKDVRNPHKTEFPAFIKTELWKILIKEHGERTFGPHPDNIVYEGGFYMISAARLEWKTKDFDIQRKVNEDAESTLPLPVRVTVSLFEPCKFSELREFLESKRDNPLPFPERIVQAGNMIMKQYFRDKHKDNMGTYTSIREYFESGRFFFVDNDANEPQVALTSTLVEGRTGFFQSLRLLQGGLSLNVDVVRAAFYQRMKLSSAWKKLVAMGCVLPEEKRDLFRDFDPQRTIFSRHMVDVVNQYWKKLPITSTHRQTKWDKEPPRVYTIDSVIEVCADTKKVPEITTKTNNINLFKLLKEKYLLDTDGLEGKLPAIKVNKKHEHYLPWGSCSTHLTARFSHNLDDNSKKKLQRTVDERYQSILRMIQRRYTEEDNIGQTRERKHFGLELQYRDMMEVPTLSLPAPKIEPANKNKFAKGAVIGDLWCVLSFVSRRGRKLESILLERLTQRAAERGMRWDQMVAIEYIDLEDDRRRQPTLHDRLERLQAKLVDLRCRVERYSRNDLPSTSKLKLMLCVMERKMNPEYAALKYYLDVKTGIPSQVVVLPADQKAISQVVNNLLLKINVKCGGQNFELSAASRRLMPLLNQNTILMGADVTHPGPNETSPSIAALVATTDSGAFNYAARLRVQRGREEQLLNLQPMVEDLLTVYKTNQGAYPDHILFFRDGVSEKFLVTSLRYEGTAILQAAKALSHTYEPRVAIIVAIKRHRTRFFVFDPRDKSQNGRAKNLPRGSVVATGVTHPIEYDFFLASHECRDGTLRPTHYHVLLDQIDIQPDALYTLVYNLCWTFQRCREKSVSLVTPVYYAHLAAFRAKVYIDHLTATNQSVKEIDAHEVLRNRLWFL